MPLTFINYKPKLNRCFLSDKVKQLNLGILPRLRLIKAADGKGTDKEKR